MQHVILKEMTGAPLDVNLPHQEYCAAAGQCFCAWQSHPRLHSERSTGERQVQRNRVRVCASVHILAKGKSEPLHLAALECGQVKSLLAVGRVKSEVIGSPEPQDGAAVAAPEVALRKKKAHKAG